MKFWLGLILSLMLVSSAMAVDTVQKISTGWQGPNYAGLSLTYDGSDNCYHLKAPVGMNVNKIVPLPNSYVRLEPVITSPGNNIASFSPDYIALLLGFKVPMGPGTFIMEGGPYYRFGRDIQVATLTTTNTITNNNSKIVLMNTTVKTTQVDTITNNITNTVTNNTTDTITNNILDQKTIVYTDNDGKCHPCGWAWGWCKHHKDKDCDDTKITEVVTTNTTTTSVPSSSTSTATDSQTSSATTTDTPVTTSVTDFSTNSTSTSVTTLGYSTIYQPSVINCAVNLGWYVNW